MQRLAQVDVVSANNWPVTSEALENFDGNHLGHISISGRKSFFKNTKPLSEELTQLVDLAQYDYVVSRYYWPAFRLGLFELNNLIIDCDDCDLEILENEFSDQKRSPARRLLSFIRYRFFRSGYLKNLQRARALIYSRRSKHAKQLSTTFEIPNKLKPADKPISAFQTTTKNSINILFVGVLNYSPNIDGIEHFLENIWPHVLAEYPDTTFTIVGANIKKRLKSRWSKHNNVVVQGFVRNIESAYEKANVCIVPVYRGGGVHIKIMEAFKYGKPTVISEESQRGYRNKIENGSHAMVACSDDDFIQMLGELISNPATRENIALQGHEVFNQFFSIDAADLTMMQIFKEGSSSAPAKETTATGLTKDLCSP